MKKTFIFTVLFFVFFGLTSYANTSDDTPLYSTLGYTELEYWYDFKDESRGFYADFFDIPEGSTILAAQYSGDKFITCEVREYTGERETFIKDANSNNAKVFALNTLTNLTPLTATAHINFENYHTPQISEPQYGYVMQVVHNGETLKLNILTASGDKISYPVYENTKINGKTFDSFSSMLEKLAESAYPSGEENYPNVSNGKYSQMIKFTSILYGGNQVIDGIITAENAQYGNILSPDHLYLYNVEGFTVGDLLTYNPQNLQLTNGTKKVNVVNATIFQIPENRAEIKNYKTISRRVLNNNEKYHMELYDVSATNTAKVILVYGKETIVDDETPVDIINTSSSVMVITDVIAEEDPTGELHYRYRLEGYIGNTAVDDYWCSEQSLEVFDTLQAGDIVILSKDTDGFYTLQPEQIIFSTAENYRDTAISVPDDDGHNNAYPKVYRDTEGNTHFKTIWGSAYQRDDELFIVSTDVLGGDEDEAAVDATRMDMQRSWFNDAKVYEFNISSLGLEITEYESGDVANVIDSLQLYDGSSLPSEVFIHMTDDSTVSTMVVIRR